MTIEILKGTDEIGGSCVELKTKNTTILLDYGTPLQDTSKKVQISENENIDAILISHPHQDHFGEIVNINKNTPIYCGELSLELMNATKIFTGNKILENNFQIFKPWKSFNIGNFKITPYLVDHSATDAYAFLIEADNKKVLYSGDFRANGRKSKLFDNMINNKSLKNIDILLMEGTMLQRSNTDFPDEQSVENKIYKTINQHNQISFIIGSSQNIDSIVSAYRACKKANKIFVIDMYTAFILEKMKLVSSSIPDMSWENVKVIKKFGGNYYQKLKENKEYFKVYTSKLFDNIIDIDDIKANPQNYFLKISPWHINKVLNYIEVNTSNIIYSQWLGYLKEEFSDIKTVELYKNLMANNNWVYAHTSGHADLPALQKFASSLKPKKLVPIHTEFKDKFSKYFDNVMILGDNESYNLNNKISKMENQMNFTRLNKDSKLVKNLKEKEWWKKIIALCNEDNDFNIQVRSDSINVYYKMANFLNIRNNNPIAEIHYKFIPTYSDKNYVKIDFDGEKANLISSVEIVENDLFNNENLKKIKSIIGKYNSKGEKGDQSILINHNKDKIIDAEIAYGNKSRIDIMVYDAKNDEIIAVEFKVITDSRLFNNEIVEQLTKYKQLMCNKEKIKKAYIDSMQVKLELDLIDKSSPLLNISEKTKIADYPILAIKAFDQNNIDRFKEEIVSRVKNCAYSLNIFGTSSDLLNFTGNNELLRGKSEN